jgi:transposase-like protein
MQSACRLRRLRPRPSSRGHLDEDFVSIGGRRMYLWPAINDEGEVLDRRGEAGQANRAQVDAQVLAATPSTSSAI